jgi:hypothetical protein
LSRMEQPPEAETGLLPGGGARNLVELWLALAPRAWGSLVLVPADRLGSTVELAAALADVGRRISNAPVTAITARALEFDSAQALADLEEHLDRERQLARCAEIAAQLPELGAEPGSVSGTGADGDVDAAPAAASPPEEKRPAEAPPSPPPRLILAVPPVVVEPLGLKAVKGADAIVLAVQLGRSRVPDVRRTIELVGRERLVGCLLVRGRPTAPAPAPPPPPAR